MKKNTYKLKDGHIYAILIVVFIFILFFSIPYREEAEIRRENELKAFINIYVNGTIRKIDNNREYSIFSIVSNNKISNFNLKIYSKPSSYFKETYFFDVARVGDSIYKPAYSDTIYLYREEPNLYSKDTMFLAPVLKEIKVPILPKIPEEENK